MDLGFGLWSKRVAGLSIRDCDDVRNLAGVYCVLRVNNPRDYRPEILRMSELGDSSELQTYSTAVLYVISAVTPVKEYIPIILDNFVTAIKSSSVS